MEATEDRLRQWQERLEGVRDEIAVAQARLQAAQQEWDAEREQSTEDARRVGELARRQLDALSAVRRKWNRKRSSFSAVRRSERTNVLGIP